MSVSANYSTPVTVNGFTCKNCTDVDYAKKHIDPAHPKSGPYGIDAKTDPTARQNTAVTFDGGLAHLNQTTPQDQTDDAVPGAPDTRPAPGTQLDISA